MKTSLRNVLIIAAAALFAGCGGSVPLAATPNGAASARQSKSGSKTFQYTGHEQHFVVPAGVTSLRVVLVGGSGEGWTYWFPLYGLGGRVDAQIPVRQGERLAVYVGGAGRNSLGGFNGGGSGGAGSVSGPGYAGAGASDVREGGDKLSDRVLVAGGGGGMGCCYQSEDTFGGNGGGGGGGSSYVEPTAMKSRMWQG